MGEEKDEHWKLKKEIDMGEIISIISIVVVVMIWGFTVKGELDITKSRVNVLEVRTMEDRANIRDEFKSVNVKLDKIMNRQNYEDRGP